MSVAEPDAFAQHTVARTAQWIGLMAAACGLLALVAWWAQFDSLLRVAPGYPTLKANTAAVVVLYGVAVALLVRVRPPALHAKVASVLVTAGMLVVALTGFQSAAGVDPGIDQLLVRDHLGGPGDPGRMPLATRSMLFFCGLALLLARSERRWASVVRESAAAIGFLGAYFALLGESLGHSHSAMVAEVTRAAPQTALLAMALCLAAVLVRPARGIGRVLVHTGSSGKTVRHLLPLAFVVPLLVGLVRGWATDAQLLEHRLSDQIMVLLIAIAFTSGLLVYAGRMGRMEERLRELNADLQSADALKNSFLSMASHELRTPLAAIRNLAETMERRWDAIADEDKHRYVGVIDAQARRLIDMVSDLLTVSRIEGGELRGDPRPVPVREIVDQVLSELSLGDVHVDVADDCVAMVDRDHFKQMLVNYLANANTYGDPPVTLRAERRGDVVRIEVRDEGPGVPDELAGQLFQRFAQIAPSRGTGGTGLGLSIVRGLARTYGGDAWYERGNPTGSCFAISLPAAARSPTR